MAPAIPVLMYHSVSDVATRGFRTWAVPAQQFDDQMQHLFESGYTTLTVSELFEARRRGAVPQRCVLLTFDDAFEDFSSTALPIMEKYGIKSTLFVPTAFVEGTSRWLRNIGEEDRSIMSWQQILDAAERGVEIGAHTHSHQMLDLLGHQAAENEIAKSKRLLESHLGHPLRTFAYPFGYRTPDVRHIVERLGFDFACSARKGLHNKDDNPFDIPRLVIPAEMGMQRFVETVAGKGVRKVAPGDDLKTYAWRQVRRVQRTWQSVVGKSSTLIPDRG